MKIAAFNVAHPQHRFGVSPGAPGRSDTPLSPASADSVHFGYGNDKQNLSVVKGSFEKEYGRLRRAGKLPPNQTREQFVGAKMATWRQRDFRK